MATPPCAANRRLRGQNRDLLAQIEANPFFPAPATPTTSSRAVARLRRRHRGAHLPVGAWQDEQTGGHFPYLLDEPHRRPDGTLKVQLYNGAHADALGPDLIVRIGEFLDFYVAERIPSIPPLIRLGAPAALRGRHRGCPASSCRPTASPATRASRPPSPPTRRRTPSGCWWESGARPGETPGAPCSTGTQGFAVLARALDARRPGTWTPTASSAPPRRRRPDGEPRAVDAYVSDPEVRPRRNYDGASDDLWHAEPDFEWAPMVDGNALTYLSEPLDEPLSIVGPSSLDLWLRSTATDTDVQVTLTEVYPDGGERYVQSGWLRASHRQLEDGRTTALSPIPTHLEADNEPLVPGELTELRVGIFPVAHTFHSGSQLRISISAPGGDRPLWSFDTLSDGEVNEVLHSVDHPSRLVLPVVADAPIADVAPACPSLRSQPCREYVAPNVVTGVEAAATGEDEVLVSWVAVPDPTDLVGYEVLGPGELTVAALGPAAVVVGTTDADTLQLTVAGLPFGQHAFAVRPVFESGPGVESSASELVTLAAQATTTTTTEPTTTTTSTPPVASTTTPSDPGEVDDDALPRTGSDPDSTDRLGRRVDRGRRGPRRQPPPHPPIDLRLPLTRVVGDPIPASRSAHGSSVSGSPSHTMSHIGQGLVCSRRRWARSAGGSNGTPRPAHTSWAWTISSSAARGTKSEGAPSTGSGRWKMTARQSSGASRTTPTSIRATIQRDATSSAGVAPSPSVRSEPTSG